jgi:hypothetical protein
MSRPINTPPISEQYSTPPPLPAAVYTIRQQERPRKSSSIMSLLNDEPSKPKSQPPPPKRVSSTSSIPVQTIRTPPPAVHHPLQTSDPISFTMNNNQPVYALLFFSTDNRQFDSMIELQNPAGSMDILTYFDFESFLNDTNSNNSD